jgi:hypothetical protein
MSTCDDIRAACDDWLDGTADPSLEADIDAHLAACEDCAQYFGRLRAIEDNLALLGDAADRLADAAGTPAPKKRHAWRPLIAVAAVLMFGFVALLRHQKQGQEGIPQLAERTGTTKHDLGSDRDPDFHMTVPDDRLALSIESDNPRIHIVWLYQETLPPGDTAGESTENAATQPG